MILKNKKVIFVCGEHKKESSAAISSLLKDSFRVLSIGGLPKARSLFSLFFSDAIVIEDNKKEDPSEVRRFMSRCSSPVIVLTGTGERLRKKKLLSGFSHSGCIIIDYSLMRKIKERKARKVITFGDRKSADLHVTDINRGIETNFKVNYKGSVTPFWIKGRLKNREIYGVISALGAGIVLDLNLVGISTSIREGRIFTEV